MTEIVNATEAELDSSAVRDKAIMDARAAALARVPAKIKRGQDAVDLVTFGLANERYGIETRYVQEIIKLTDYTPIPATPAFVLGVANLRGVVLPIFDIRKFLNVGAQGISDLTRIIVLGAARPEFGLLVDDVYSQQELSADQLLPTPQDSAGTEKLYLRGMTQDAVIILDGERILKDEKLYVNKTAK